MDQLLLSYCQLLLNNIQADNLILNQWWMWAFACVPALGYFVVMAIKYTLLLLPVWLIIGLSWKGLGVISAVAGTIVGRFKRAVDSVIKKEKNQ